MEFCPLGLGWTPQWPILKTPPNTGDGPVRGRGVRTSDSVDEPSPLGLISRVDSLDSYRVGHLSQLFNAWYMNTAADPIPVDPEEDRSADLGRQCGGLQRKRSG